MIAVLVEDCADSNLLYSLGYNLGTTINIPGCNPHEVKVHQVCNTWTYLTIPSGRKNMTVLCEKHCPDELKAIPKPSLS